MRSARSAAGAAAGARLPGAFPGLAALLLVLLVAAIPGRVSAQTAAAPSREAGLQPLADSLARNVVGRAVAGLSIGVWLDGRPVAAGAWGWADPAGGVPVWDGTVFRLASVTKQLIAASALLAEDRGALHLDATVEEVLGIRLGDGTLRLRHLLTQTSGLSRAADTLLVMLATEHGTDRELLLPLLARGARFEHAPGAGWQYANTNYVLAGWMLEAVTGQPLGLAFEALFRDELGLRGMRWCPFVDGDPQLARGHTVQEGALVPFGGLPPWYETTGGAGLACGTRDALGGWGNLLLEQAELLGRLSTPVLLGDGSTSLYRYGVIADPFFGTARVAHSGAALGASARIAVLPELRAVVVVLANTQATSVVEAIEARLSRRLVETLR
jgi:D-alanyl-D-alanine carboxypeptidase